MSLERKRKPLDKIPVDMTPMIDVVFQLLTFFCMTLRVATAEGDFQISMPQKARDPSAHDPQLPPIHIFLRADADGACNRVVLADREFSGANRWDRLHQHLAGIVGTGNLAEHAEVELHCDANLHYEHAIAAITAVSGRINPADGQIVKLVENIKFSPPGR